MFSLEQQTGFLDGLENIAIGASAMKSSVTAYENIAIGEHSMGSAEGFRNIGIGGDALYLNSGHHNIAIGDNVLSGYNSGQENIGIGHNALDDNLEGTHNIALGASALSLNATGGHNVAIGRLALSEIQHLDFNTGVGAYAGRFGERLNSTAIGYDASPGGSNTVRLGNAAVSAIGGYANLTNVSDARVKVNVREDVRGLEFINLLRPVTYNLDMDAIARIIQTPDSLRLFASEAMKASETQIGFIAQEVELAAESIDFEFHGVDKPENESQHYGLRYAEFVAPLVKAVQELSVQNQAMQLQIEAMQQEIDMLKKD
jgi:hypothetical protein